MKFLDKYQSQLLAVLRIVSGLLFLEHGCVKLLHFPTSMPMPPGNAAMIVIVAGVIELVGGALITVGLFSRIAAFIASGEMAFAYFMLRAAGFGRRSTKGARQSFIALSSSIWRRPVPAHGRSTADRRF
jgi:uncharacterized membrane protein YphA (DoxX/SURF4 family)